MKLRGCRKRVICVEKPDSRLFEEALFVLREEAGGVPESDMLAEANRILEESMVIRGGACVAKPARPRWLGRLLCFLLGAAVSGIPALCLLLLR